MSGWRRIAARGLALALIASGRLAGQEGAPASALAPSSSEASVAPQPEPEAGPLVTAIEIRSDAPLTQEADFDNLIEAEVGIPVGVEDPGGYRHTLPGVNRRCDR